MWVKVIGSDNARPADVDFTSSRNWARIRRNITHIPATDEQPAHYEWEELKVRKDGYEISQMTLDHDAEIGGISLTTGIAFVVLAESGAIDPVTAGEHAEIFAEWKSGVNYTVGNIRRYDGELYQCLQSHTSQPDWTPPATPALWKRIADPAEEWPEWSQPISAADTYDAGAKVSHNGKHWISDVDNNAWEPGIYGWDEVDV